jgi:hypothetical protein
MILTTQAQASDFTNWNRIALQNCIADDRCYDDSMLVFAIIDVMLAGGGYHGIVITVCSILV